MISLNTVLQGLFNVHSTAGSNTSVGVHNNNNNLPHALSNSALVQATLRSVRSQILLKPSTPLKKHIALQLKQNVTKAFRSGLVGYEVELCEKLAQCNDITTSNPIQKRLDIVSEIVTRMDKEDPVLGTVLCKIRDEYERAIKELMLSRDGAGRISSFALQRLADQNEMLTRSLKKSKDELHEKTRKLAELTHQMELLEIDSESQKEQIMDLTQRLITNSKNLGEMENADDLCQYMTGEVHDFSIKDASPRKAAYANMTKSITRAEEKIHILEDERIEVEEANKLAESMISRISDKYQGVVEDWNRKHIALYGAVARFHIDEDDGEGNVEHDQQDDDERETNDFPINV